MELHRAYLTDTMNRALFFLVYFLFSANGFAQNRNNIWFYGESSATLNFNFSPPIWGIPYNNMQTYEGCSNICDNNGSKLFYTNGVKVWGRNDLVMSNGSGLLGHISSSQAALIIPKPCDTNIYYIFTTNQDTSTPLSYSIVDMSLAGGDGDVTIKNVPLHHPVTESLYGTLKSNGSDYWVVSHVWGENKYLSYSVTSSGVNPVPVISYGGNFTSFSFTWAPGYIRISPDGTKLCKASPYYVDLFDFDNSTGMLSNPITLPISVSGLPYGVDFSPDNSKLYISTISQLSIEQFNLQAGSATAIQNSGVVIADGLNTPGGTLRLAPDNKIYVARSYTSYLGVINQPNLLGTACNYVDLGQLVGSGGPTCMIGLPNTLNSYSVCCAPATNLSSNVSICENQTYQLPSGATVSTAGLYNDTVRNQLSCDSIIFSINLSVHHPSIVNTEAQICSNESYQLPSGLIVSNAGTYIVLCGTRHPVTAL